MRSFCCAWIAGWLAVTAPVVAQARVLLQGFYWDVPSPAAGNARTMWWWDRLAAQALALRRAGFTAVWLPPVTKGASGGHSVGYDPFDDYDIGSRDQRGTVPTRYGTREQLVRCVAMLRAAGLDVYLDLVQNHRNGDPGDFQFRYKDAYGVEGRGRFPKYPADFHPHVPQDPEVPLGDQEYPFGRDIAHVNGENGRIGRELKAAGDWLTRTLDVQGYRLDYVKGISARWLREFLDYGAMRSRFAIGEYYDGNLDLVAGWVRDSMRNRVAAFDFPLCGLLHQMCAQSGQFDMRLLDGAGFAGRDPARAVTFVENHDTDRESPVIKGKMLAYAYILTATGYPSVFYRDYSMEPGCYRLKPRLDRLLQVHAHLASGGQRTLWKDPDVFIFERTGGRRLLVGLSDDPFRSRTITVPTGFGPRVRLRDYAGHMPDLQTDARGYLRVTMPANRDGDGYVCYAPVMLWPRVMPVRPRRVTQEFHGAPDLDIPPISSEGWTVIGRVWPRPGHMITARLFCDTGAWDDRTRVVLELIGPDGRLASQVLRSGRQASNVLLRTRTLKIGWHTWRARACGLPSGRTALPCRLRVHYLAASTLAAK